MQTASELAGVRNVHWRLLFVILLAVFAAVLLHGLHSSWLLLLGVALLAVGAGLATLWSP
jgi:hypothetical protein